MEEPATESRRLLEWPGEDRFYLTLDLECDYGTALSTNTFGALDHVDRFVAVLEDRGVPLTCFVQTQVLEERPEAVASLESADVDVAFHPHSHTHAPRDETSVQEEIEVSSERYATYFDREPTGYRLPNGNVRPEDYRHLAASGYDFDASVFPSWRPNHFDNTSAPTTPHYLPDHDLVELPFTVYSERVRIPTSLSYCRLLGRPFTGLLGRSPPSTMVFNVHMHDLVNPPAYDDLSRFYRAIYARNADGLGMLDRVLARFDELGYAFGHLDDVNDRIRAGE